MTRIEEMEKDAAELAVKIKDIALMIDGRVSFLCTKKYEKDLLIAQHDAMVAYLSALSARITLIERGQ